MLNLGFQNFNPIFQIMHFLPVAPFFFTYGTYELILRSELTSCLRENQNKEKELFLKISSSQTFSCNTSSQQEF